MKYIIIAMFLAMVVSLGFGLFYLLKSPDTTGGSSDKLFKALTWRIGIWVVLFLFLLLAIHMKWIEPSNSVHPERFNEAQKERMK